MKGYQGGKGGWVYIVGNPGKTVLYTGVTSDVTSRMAQHKTGHFGGFTAQYHCTQLLWHEAHTDIRTAIAREKQLKNWKRAWKLELIQAGNPEFLDLAADW